MAYVLLLVYLLVVVPDVLCYDSDVPEEFCANDTPGRPFSWTPFDPKSYGDIDAMIREQASGLPPCKVPVCNLTAGKEEVILVSCPDKPKDPTGQKCTVMEKQRPYNNRVPFCCDVHLCEPQGNVSGIFQTSKERNYYPSYRSYSEYEELLIENKLYEKEKGKSCKDMGFQLPENCKLVSDDEKIPSEGGCHYMCHVPLTKTILNKNVENTEKCSFTHNGIEYSNETRGGRCERWECKNNAAYIHMCITNTSTIPILGNCTITAGSPSGNAEAYPDCCPKLTCSTELPWELAFSKHEYTRTFA